MQLLRISYFFVDMIDFSEIDTIVEFGCGNAELLKSIYNIYPAKTYIVIDSSQEMLKRDELNFNNCVYIKSDKLPEIKSKNCILILSSVLHELYTYSSSYAKSFLGKR